MVNKSVDSIKDYLLMESVCIRMLYIKGYLYVTEDRHDKVIIYDVSTRTNTLFDFDSRCSGGARGYGV